MVATRVLADCPETIGRLELAVGIWSDPSICLKVSGQGRPVEAEVGAHAGVGGDPKVIGEQEVVDRGHEGRSLRVR